MKVLLDECLPRRLGRELAEHHETVTVPQAGWAGIKNGKLLALIDDSPYEAFITMDSNMEAQQQLMGRSFGIIVLHATSNKIEDLRPLILELLKTLAALKPGMVCHVPKR